MIVAVPLALNAVHNQAQSRSGDHARGNHHTQTQRVAAKDRDVHDKSERRGSNIKTEGLQQPTLENGLGGS